MKKISKRLLALLTASVMVCSLAACGGKDKEPADDTTPTSTNTESTPTGTDEAATDSYTLNLALADFPTNWSPHQQQTNTDAGDMLYYMEAPLYDLQFLLNRL